MTTATPKRPTLFDRSAYRGDMGRGAHDTITDANAAHVRRIRKGIEMCLELKRRAEETGSTFVMRRFVAERGKLMQINQTQAERFGLADMRAELAALGEEVG